MDNTEFEKLELLSTLIGDNISVTHSHYVFNNKMFGKADYKQISVQQWKNGKIIKDNHFHNLGY